MLVGSKTQLKAHDLDDLVLTCDQSAPELVNHLRIHIKSNISWDHHVLKVRKQMYYRSSLPR